MLTTFASFKPRERMRRGAVNEARTTPAEEIVLDVLLADASIHRLIRDQAYRVAQEGRQGLIPNLPTTFRRGHRSFGEADTARERVAAQRRNVEMRRQSASQSGLPGTGRTPDKD